jgi:signal transduction histidine kinase
VPIALMVRLRSPLVPITSIKTKWSFVIVAAVAVTAGMSQLGVALGWPVWLRPIVAGALALVAVQVLAKGMTSPLRAMSDQAKKIAEGNFAGRVYPDSEDEIGRLARSLNDMAEQLAELDRQQKEFIANASHELRTPVAAIQTQLENVVDRVTEPSPEVLHRLLQQTEHLGRLVSQLLDLSRLDATQTAPKPELVAVGVLLKQVVHEAQLLHPGARVELRSSGPLGVSADEQLLHQLFTNLILNALRFAPIGSAILVDASGDGETVTISVSDEGPGIPPELRSRVFERFWQADGSGPTGRGGAGLGLAICKRIVELHDGEVSIHTNRPSGTTVRVQLPAN